MNFENQPVEIILKQLKIKQNAKANWCLADTRRIKQHELV